MSNTTLSTNMNLPVPSVGIDPGPQWGSDLNACLTLIDAHNHSLGSGVQITPSGLNINADLPFGGNNATTLKEVRFSNQTAAITSASPDISALYSVGSGGDLYYNDSAGHQIQITNAGSVSGSTGTITGLPSGTAGAAFASSTFKFTSATLTAANVDGRNMILRNSTASSKGLTLQPPTAMGSDYSLTLPSVPAQTNVMSLDNTGAMSSVTFDAVGTTMTSVGANAIATSMTRSTGTSVAANGVAIGSGSGAYSSTGVSYSVIDTCTIVTSGRPVALQLIAYSTSGQAFLLSGHSANIKFRRDSTDVAIHAFQTGAVSAYFPVSAFSHIDAVGAGTYVYTAQGNSDTASVLGVTNAKIVAFEL